MIRRMILMPFLVTLPIRWYIVQKGGIPKVTPTTSTTTYDARRLENQDRYHDPRVMETNHHHNITPDTNSTDHPSQTEEEDEDRALSQASSLEDDHHNTDITEDEEEEEEEVSTSFEEPDSLEESLMILEKENETRSSTQPII